MNKRKWVLFLSISLLVSLVVFIGTDNSIKSDFLLFDSIGIYYDNIDREQSANGTIYIVRKNGKYGILNQNALTVLPLIYDSIETYSSIDYGTIYIIKKTGKFGILNQDGVVILPFIYDFLQSCSDTRHILSFQKSNKQGYIDLVNMQEIRHYYDYASSSFYQGRAQVYLNNKWGFVDDKGIEVIPCIYDSLEQLVYSWPQKVYLKDRWILIDMFGSFLGNALSPSDSKKRFAEYFDNRIKNMDMESATFTIGSTKKEVLQVQGDPSAIIGDSWLYNRSMITFKNGKVHEYVNNGNLKIKIR